MESFFQIHFEFLTENIQMNNEMWMLIKVQCFIYKWILLNKLYELMESFFQISS